ncbi:MAG: hypothetical protein M1813_003004 [Trichoglossum hirsutum]|nr:MAG: hypothetical protein M1813_003004 [Trichoglossum hirsutum]
MTQPQPQQRATQCSSLPSPSITTTTKDTTMTDAPPTAIDPLHPDPKPEPQSQSTPTNREEGEGGGGGGGGEEKEKEKEATSGTPSAPQNPQKRTRPGQPSSSNSTMLHTAVLRPTWSYIVLRQLGGGGGGDATTLRLQLTAALAQFLGDTGAGVPVDIVGMKKGGEEAWVRVPAEDLRKVVAAVGGWVGSAGGEGGDGGWRVMRAGRWLGGVVGEGEEGEGVWTFGIE